MEEAEELMAKFVVLDTRDSAEVDHFIDGFCSGSACIFEQVTVPVERKYY